MTDMVKKYVPYAVIILLVYMLLPLVFIPGAMQKFSPVAYDFVFPITAIGCSAHYCSNTDLTFSLHSLRRLFIFRVCSSTTEDFLLAHFQQTLFSS